MMRYTYFWFSFFAFVFACKKGDEKKDTLFVKLDPARTGIDFENNLSLVENFDVFRYRNYYNGGGVAIGDINNDGLADIYLTSNMTGNRLYLNKGNLKFQDITSQAHVKGTRAWSTGVSMADVNSDGLLDIYVCNSGDINGNNRQNELFINQGDLTFKEQAAEFGLNDNGFSTHAVFFDYDQDGDLDCYILNNSFRPISTLGYRNLRDERDKDGGDKLMKNEGGKFIDVSEEAGIFGSVIGFGLGVTVGDVNNDNWQDIYVSNDFYERDYLYINNHDGTFSERLEDYLGHLSMFSMGADLADLNNDGLPEIFSTDMLPRDDYRLKSLSSFEAYEVYQIRLRNGYYHQYMRNMLQANTGNNGFIELGFLAGVAGTDWSWGALMADFDNDGYREIFVCNGIYKDVTEQDFVDFMGSSEQIKAAMEGKKIDFMQFVDRMSSTKLSNCLYKRVGDWNYKDVASNWGLDEPSFSNGAAYGDLDNDGDLDLIVNNVNQPIFVYENKLDSAKNNFLKVSFKGSEGNLFGLCSSVFAHSGKEVIAAAQMPIRGFQSSMDYTLTIGTGERDIDSVVIRWPDGKEEVILHPSKKSRIIAEYTNAKVIRKKNNVEKNTLLSESGISFIRHQENEYNDFDHERLIYHMRSTEGPGFAKADINGDGLDDFFLGGSVGKVSTIYLQTQQGDFKRLITYVFDADSLSEDVAAEFFDADGDKDLDLIVVTGGVENSLRSVESLDRLYLNQGLKNGWPFFVKSKTFPALYQSGSCVRAMDVDNDGDQDLFIGNRLQPAYYGLPCDQVLLVNDGQGNFSDASATLAPEFKKLGMVTDACWFDFDKNGFKDIVVVGEWMKPTVFLNDGSRFSKHLDTSLDSMSGWWNAVKSSDIDGDGDEDLLLGNLGWNSRFKPTRKEPVNLYVSDFDQNGSLDPVFSYYNNGIEYPAALRQDLIKQMPSLKKRFVYYKQYAGKNLKEVIDPEQLKSAKKLSFEYPSSCLLLNNGKMGFEICSLPVQAQVSPVFAIEFANIDHDKNKEVILAGNFFSVKPEIGRYDALQGMVLKYDSQNAFQTLASAESGLDIRGEVRHVSSMRCKDGVKLIFIRNNDSVKLYKIN